MSKKVVEAFVRAKPKEISVTETYCYKAEISDNDHLSFEDANGDIKVKFFYDGQGFHWKFLGFLRRKLLPRWLRKRWAQLFGWTPLSWLSSFLKARVGQKGTAKCFDAAAIEDARKYTGKCSMARVGYLALWGYDRSNFEGRWPESRTLRLEIPIDNLEQKLAQSQKYELCYTYPLQKPEIPLPNFGRITLTDVSSESLQGSLRQTNSNFGKLHSKTDEVLRLELELMIDGGEPELDDDNQLSEEIVKRWWEEYETEKKKSASILSKDQKKKNRKWRKKEKNEDEDEKEDNEPVLGQIICREGLRSNDELREAIKSLIWRGGYLIIRLDKLEEVETLKKRLLKVVLEDSIWLLPPYRHEKASSKRKQWVVVPVPMQPRDSTSYRHSHLSIQSKPFSSLIEVHKILGNVNETEILARYISARANAAGGKLFLPVSANSINNSRNKIYEDTKEKFWEAAQCCRPEMPLHPSDFEELKDGVSVSIRRASSEVYSVKGGKVYTWEDGKPPKELSVDETYQFIQDRCALSYPLITSLPFISYAYINWLCFDPREADGVRYDPQKKVIKWSDRVWFWQTPDHQFRLTLPLVINRPIELYRQGSIQGQLHLELGGYLKSGLEINHFDALGKQNSQSPDDRPEVKKKSKIEIEFNITLEAIFRNRLFKTSRILEFDGVRPNVDRLEEIKGVMGDLGLENIQVDYAKTDWLGWHPIPISDDTIEQALANGGFVIEAHRPPNLNVTVKVNGKLKHLYREHKHGERSDRMRVQTGNMQINIEGSIRDEPPQTLSILLNRLQQMLTERFSHIGTKVV